MADAQEGVESYSMYIAVPNGVWETIPYQAVSGKAVLVSDLSAKVPLGTTRVYVKAVSGGQESEAKARTIYRSAINLVTPSSARVTEYYSWW